MFYLTVKDKSVLETLFLHNILWGQHQLSVNGTFETAINFTVYEIQTRALNDGSWFMKDGELDTRLYLS